MEVVAERRFTRDSEVMSRNGRILAPVMPYGHYGKLTDADAHALAQYLKNLKPVRHQVPAVTGAAEKPSAPYLTVVMP